MLNKNILFIGSNLITYEILSYLYSNNLVGGSSIYLYDESIMYKRDYYRLSWWLNERNKEDDECASKICIKYFTNCKSVSKNNLSQFGSTIPLPEIVIFTSSHIMKKETFKKLEKVVISKFDDFIPHYMVKVLASYYKMGYGSGELYDKLIMASLKQ